MFHAGAQDLACCWNPQKWDSTCQRNITAYACMRQDWQQNHYSLPLNSPTLDVDHGGSVLYKDSLWWHDSRFCKGLRGSLSKTSNYDVKCFMHDKLNAKVSFSQRLKGSKSWDLLPWWKRKLFRTICYFRPVKHHLNEDGGLSHEQSWAQMLMNRDIGGWHVKDSDAKAQQC